MPAVLFIICLLAALPVAADSGPTLARLYYKVPPDRLAEFEETYQELIEPFVDEHGLVESSVPAPPAGEGFFVRVFEFPSSAAWAAARKAIDDDPQLPELRRDLVARFPFLAEPGSSSFTLLTAPAEPETTRVAGPGKTAAVGPGRGIWRTYDATNGLAGPWVRSIIQDRQGHLWFATYRHGASRYDGQTWQTFTTRDGLADDRVYAVYQDRDGYFWFATHEGLNRYAPSAPEDQQWTTKPSKTAKRRSFARSRFLTKERKKPITVTAKPIV